MYDCRDRPERRQGKRVYAGDSVCPSDSFEGGRATAGSGKEGCYVVLRTGVLGGWNHCRDRELGRNGGDRDSDCMGSVRDRDRLAGHPSGHGAHCTGFLTRQIHINRSQRLAIPSRFRTFPAQRDRFQTAARSSSPFHPGITGGVLAGPDRRHEWALFTQGRHSTLFASDRAKANEMLAGSGREFAAARSNDQAIVGGAPGQ